MGLVFQMVGFLVAIASLIYNVIAIVNSSSNMIGVLLLVVGVLLIKTGRNIYKNQKR